MKIEALDVNQIYSRDFLSSKNDNVSLHFHSMPQSKIRNNVLNSYEKDYEAVGGNKIPTEILNMILKKIIPVSTIPNKSIQLELFDQICKQISSLGIRNSKEIWRIAYIYTKIEYGHRISYLSWKLHVLLKSLRL